MDELKMKLSTKFMRNIAAKLMERYLYKQLGYKIKIQLNELDVDIVDGETNISTNVELKLDSKEFVKIMKSIGEKES